MLTVNCLLVKSALPTHYYNLPCLCGKINNPYNSVVNFMRYNVVVTLS